MSPSHKQRGFVAAYLRCWNGKRAALEASYTERGAKRTASPRLLKLPEIAAAIKVELAARQMTAAEGLEIYACRAARTSRLDPCSPSGSGVSAAVAQIDRDRNMRSAPLASALASPSNSGKRFGSFRLGLAASTSALARPSQLFR